MNNRKLVLASASPRRQELLEMLGVDLIIDPSGAEETGRPGESPREHALRLALEKARDVSSRYPCLWVLGADTIVVIDGEVLGKPANEEDARQMLVKLSGREHLVITAFALVFRKQASNIPRPWSPG